jgi:hypothetical protein
VQQHHRGKRGAHRRKDYGLANVIMRMLDSILSHSYRRINCRRKKTLEPLEGSLPWLRIRELDLPYTAQNIIHNFWSRIGKQSCFKINMVNTDTWAYEALQRSQLHVVELVNNAQSFQFKLYISGKK